MKGTGQKMNPENGKEFKGSWDFAARPFAWKLGQLKSFFYF
jgi:hypothetical protein